MVRLSDIDLPMIFKNKLLFSHGIRNNLEILPDEVNKSLLNTNWEDQRNRSLFFSHHDRDAQKWVGRINNPRVVNGELYGDLEIHDADLALKIGPGKAPIGVSAEIRWPLQYSNPIDFSYRGFAMVPNPEVPETMINFSKHKEDGFNSATLHIPFTNDSTVFSKEKEEDFATVTAMEEKRKSLGMSIDEFYAAPRDPSSSSALPIFDESHVRNALARFTQTQFKDEKEKEKAKRKILAAAKKMGIEVSADFSEQEEEIIINEEDKKTVEEPIEKEESTISTEDKTEEVESDLMSVERGFELRMENNANNVEEEVKETVEETTTEEPAVEEAKEADFSEIKASIEALSSRIAILEENQAKFSKEEEKEEEESEEEESDKEEESKEEEESEEAAEEEKAEEVEEFSESEEKSEDEESEEAAEEDSEEASEPEEEAKADFSKELSEKFDKLADAILAKKEAAPMSTAEFGAKSIDKDDAVIDRLTKSLSN